MGILFKLTVFFREIMVTANVAFVAGSSQQGKARLAAVGCIDTDQLHVFKTAPDMPGTE